MAIIIGCLLFRVTTIQRILYNIHNIVRVIFVGWGSWSGEGVKLRRQAVLRHSQNKPFRKVDNVTVNEQQDKKFAKHLVGVRSFYCNNDSNSNVQINTVPWPYTTFQQFEKTHCTPLGRHWNAETTFQKVIQPQVMKTIGM